MNLSSKPKQSQLAVDVEDFAVIFAKVSDEIGQGNCPPLDDLCTQYPQHAGDLRELYPMMLAMASVGSESGSTSSITTKQTLSFAEPLGDFRIVREIGRGGMGVVYEATQLSLDRTVALKVLPFASMLDPRHLTRFKNEARAAASLKHPHIVSVYNVGNERGVHYYAMEYVEGCSLAEILTRQRDEDNLSASRLLKKSGATAGLSSSESISPGNTAGQASSGTHFSERRFSQETTRQDNAAADTQPIAAPVHTKNREPG